MSSELQERILTRLSTGGRDAVPSDVLQQELGADAKETASALRALLENRRVTLRRGGAGDTRTYLSLSNDLSENFSLVLDAIRASGCTGVDQAQLASKLRLPKSEILKAIHALLAQKHIQERRSFTNRAKRIYLLFHLKPSSQVTGGTLYCGEELDTPFVDELRRRMVALVTHKRSVSLAEMTKFLEEECAMGNAGGDGGDRGGTSPHSTGPSFSASPFASPSNPIAFISSSGGSIFPGVPPNPIPTPMHSKRVLPRDVQVLLQSLVLDGVLDEVRDPGQVSQYQLTTGNNIMRHFTCQRKRQRGSDAMVPGSSHRQQLLALMHDVGLWEPAPVSQPTAGLSEAGGWSYMAGQGFPCLGCPMLATCTASDKGLINPVQCSYLNEWLE